MNPNMTQQNLPMVKVDLGAKPGELLLTFDYEPALIERVRLLPGRRYDKKLKGWVVPFTAEMLAELSERLGTGFTTTAAVNNQSTQLLEKTALAQDLKASTTLDLSGAFTFPTTKPLLHQKRGLAIAEKCPKFVFAWKPRCGKTFAALAIMRWLRNCGEGRPFLIVAPASVLHVWEDQAKLHQPGLRITALTGAVSVRKTVLATGIVDAFVINPEALWRMENELKAIKWGGVFIDELHRFKHRTSQQTKSLRKIIRGLKTDRVHGFTGSFHDNSPLEIWSQMDLVEPAALGSSFYGFRDRYALLGGYQGKQVVGYKNLDELRAKLSGHVQYVSTEECWDLPPTSFEVRRLEMTGDQATAYKAMARDLVAEVAGTEISVTVLAAKLMKLRQILAGFAYASDGSIHYLKENAKLKALGELLEDLPKDAKVIVWGVFHPELAAVERLLDERGIGHVRLDGTVPLAHRKSLVGRFQEDVSCRVFVGQAQAGGLGLDLSAASHTVFMTNELDRSIRLQAEARPVGPHQKAARVAYYDFVCKGTWDVAGLRRLKSKAEVSDKLNERAVIAAVYGEEA